MTKAYGALLLQFDMAAIFPGDWNHIVMQTRQQFEYAGMTSAANNEFWTYENSYSDANGGNHGINRTAWYSAYVLGYQMPANPVLQIVALQLEMYKAFPLWADAPTNTKKLSYGLTAMANFTLGPRDPKMDVKRHSLAVAVQTASRIDNNGDVLFMFGSAGLFGRIALIYNYKLW
jgi:hypothetical protein